jgi:Ca2+-binding RTX toxin-like protein
VITRRIAIAVSAALAAAVLLCPSVSAAPSVTCDYIQSSHKVKATIHGSGYVTLGRDNMSRIKFSGIWCDNAATVYNTDQINVFAGDGDQALTVNVKANDGFQPGFTDERGSSNEVEISISLGGGDHDLVNIVGEGAADHFVAGRSSGSLGLLGRVNANADESSGLDADITLIVGIEQLTLFGNGGADTLSGAGGYGTGESYVAHMYISGVDGADSLTGGEAADNIYGGPGMDTLKGGPGPDYLNSQDGVQGNDEVFGGIGNDSCVTDPGDSKTSC